MNEATARSPRKTINQEFQVHRLNPTGLNKADEVASLFDALLEGVKGAVPEGRELSLAKTHLEQAWLCAAKGLAKQPVNQL